jgi:hypothetical protein
MNKHVNTLTVIEELKRLDKLRIKNVKSKKNLTKVNKKNSSRKINIKDEELDCLNELIEENELYYSALKQKLISNGACCKRLALLMELNEYRTKPTNLTTVFLQKPTYGTNKSLHLGLNIEVGYTFIKTIKLNDLIDLDLTAVMGNFCIQDILINDNLDLKEEASNDENNSSSKSAKDYKIGKLSDDDEGFCYLPIMCTRYNMLKTYQSKGWTPEITLEKFLIECLGYFYTRVKYIILQFRESDFHLCSVKPLREGKEARMKICCSDIPDAVVFEENMDLYNGTNYIFKTTKLEELELLYKQFQYNIKIVNNQIVCDKIESKVQTEPKFYITYNNKSSEISKEEFKRCMTVRNYIVHNSGTDIDYKLIVTANMHTGFNFGSIKVFTTALYDMKIGVTFKYFERNKFFDYIDMSTDTAAGRKYIEKISNHDDRVINNTMARTTFKFLVTTKPSDKIIRSQFDDMNNVFQVNTLDSLYDNDYSFFDGHKLHFCLQ